MANRQLGQAIIDDPIRSTHFFNGRLLSAEDLMQEQEASEKARARLGKAIGTGVAYGLEVEESIGVSTTAEPVVTIKPGLAVNREGETLWLTKAVKLALKRPPVGDANGGGAGFAACIPPEEGAYVAGDGVYLLTILPIDVNEGKAPVSGLGATSSACNIKTVARSAQFRLIELPNSLTTPSDPPRLRNRLAHRCFGTLDDSYQAFYANLFGPAVSSYGLIDDLLVNRLYTCEVPLALLYWTSTGGLGFVDIWSVRRRLTTPDAAPRWSILTGDRRASEGEAMFLQFADQINDMVKNHANPAGARARDYFRWLPPVGVIPLANALWPKGFTQLAFFNGMTVREPVFIEGARLAPLVRASWNYAPLDIQSGVMVWLYAVRENMQAITSSTVSTSPQPYLIFASGHLPFWGDPHHDVHRADYSNAI